MDKQITKNYECSKRSCKWQGTLDQKNNTPVKCDINNLIKTCPKCGGSEFFNLLNSFEPQKTNDKFGWISVLDKLPEPNTKVLIIRDVRKWDVKRKPYADIASVGFLEEETLIGGPISLTGYHNLKGIYFSVPAILHPDSVTFWQPIPEFYQLLN